MRTRKILTLSASLAAVVLVTAPAAAQSMFRDDGSVTVNRSVLDSLEPRLKRPAGKPAPRHTNTPHKHKPPVTKPVKVAKPESPKPQPANTAPPEPVKVAEPAKPESVKPEPPKPLPQAPAESAPAKPEPPAPVAQAPRTRLVGPLTDLGDEEKLVSPILPQPEANRTLSPTAPAPRPTAAAAAPATTPPLPPKPDSEPPAKVAALTPPGATVRGMVTPPLSAPSTTPTPPSAQPPAVKAEPVTSRGGSGAVIVQSNGSLRLLFPANEATLPEEAQTALEAIARRMEAEHNLYIQLLAYAEGTDDEASKARRLSLSRALAVRSYLMNDGVRSTRIDVRALGHKVPDGPNNRVDVVIDKRY